VRVAVAALVATLAVAGCSWFGSDKEPAAAPATATTMSDEALKKNCQDPKWREENLGLWYSVCRQPLRF